MHTNKHVQCMRVCNKVIYVIYTDNVPRMYLTVGASA